MIRLEGSIPHINQIFFDTAVLKTNTAAERAKLADGGFVYLEASAGVGRQKVAVIPGAGDIDVTGPAAGSENKNKFLYPVFISRPADANFDPIPANGLITFINPITAVELWVDEANTYLNGGTFTAGKKLRVMLNGSNVACVSPIAEGTITNGAEINRILWGHALSGIVDGKVKVRFQF